MRPFHRHLFRNRRALVGYLDGSLPDIEALRQEIELLEREDNPRRPEHVLKGVRHFALPKSSGTLLALLNHVLGELAEEHLAPYGDPPLVVPAARFECWQELTTDCPPMVLVARALLRDHEHLLPSARDADHRALSGLLDLVQRQVQDSVLPTGHDPRLEYLIEREGLDELHMHLNGTSEVELVWLDALARPRKFVAEFFQTRRKGSVGLQLEQEERGLDHAGLLGRLRLANALRYRLAQVALGGSWDFEDVDAWLQTPSAWDVPWPFQANHHPLATHFGLDVAPSSKLALETALWVYLQAHLIRTDDLRYGHALYAYLLVFCQFQRLLVQQRDQVGFDQFQRITENGLRENLEQRYGARYQQLARSDPGDLAVLEGRFAPKADHGKAGRLLRAILGDWHSPGARRRGCHTLQTACENASQRSGRAQLRLVAHFIKKRDKKRFEHDLRCRHHKLRVELDRQWHVLRRLLERYPDLGGFVAGFDAAANELHAPPEVFAPLFRNVRRAGYTSFTYHVGEDFVHLVSGLRAMSETMTLLDFTAGNRIGHGTAMGIDVALWQQAMPEKVVLRRQDRLDDLVWARRMFAAAGLAEGLVTLDDEIAALARDIYGESVTSGLLHRAWTLRHLDPRAARWLTEDGDRAWLSRETRRMYEDARKARDDDEDAFALFLRYHDGEVVARGEEPVEVDAVAPSGPLDGRGLHRLQCLVADEVRRRGVVLEALPTSNLRISFYRRYREHHIFRWLGLTGEKPVPTVLGTDDPGIFATSLRNEYLHVLRELDARCAGADESVRYLEALVTNGKRYVFRPRRPLAR